MASPHWTYRKTPEREEKIEKLRKYLTAAPGGERIYGTITTAQIIDWALDNLLVPIEQKTIASNKTNPD